MFRPGGMSSDDDSDWDEHYFSQSTPIDAAKDTFKTPEVSLEEKLLEAVTNKDIDRVKELLNEGADVNYSAEGNWSSIIQASFSGCFEMVKLLVERGADVNSSHEKFTPVLAICSSTSKDEDKLLICLNVLISAGAQINITDWYRIPALSHAIRHSHLRLVNELIERGVDINVTDQDGWTPIFYAVELGKVDFVSLLMNAGASIYENDRKGRSLLDIACEKENLDVIKLLNGGLEMECVISMDENVNQTNVSKHILSTLPCFDDRLSGFKPDVFNILAAIKLSHLNKHFYNNNFGLGHLLNSNENTLKNIGVKFWFERRKILRSVEKFHEYPWDMRSFGIALSHEDVDSLQTTKVMATLTRQLYVISVTTYVWTEKGGITTLDTMLPNKLKESLRTIKVLRGKLKSLQTTFKRINEEDNAVPSDLILSSGHTVKNKLCSKGVVICFVLTGLFLLKKNFTFSLPSLLRQHL